MKMQFNTHTQEHTWTGTQEDHNDFCLKNAQKNLNDFNTLLDCVQESASFEDFKRFYGDDIRDFFVNVDGRSEKRVFNLLKNQEKLKIFETEIDGKKYFNSYSIFYMNSQLKISKIQICEVTKKEKELDAKEVLTEAAMRESFYQNRATDKQIAYIESLCKKSVIGKEFLESAKNSNFVLTKKEASFAIKNLTQ